MPKDFVPKILIVFKKSSYEEHVLDEKDRNYLRLLRERSIATRKSKSTHDIHMDTLETVKNHLKTLRIPFDVKRRFQLSAVRGYDLVVTIGGDGTFLETSHHLEDGLILGVNSVPKESVGYYCKATADNFLEKIYEFIAGHSRTQTLHRLSMTIDGKRVGPYALNDILFANTHPAGTTRYTLKVNGRSEEQKSSGLWISPAPGSTAAIKSSGGKALPIGSRLLQYVVREPYAPPGKKYRLLKGVLKPHQQVEIFAMMDGAAVYVDGPHCEYPVKRGDRIVIRNADKPIRAIW